MRHWPRFCASVELDGLARVAMRQKHAVTLYLLLMPLTDFATTPHTLTSSRHVIVFVTQRSRAGCSPVTIHQSLFQLVRVAIDLCHDGRHVVQQTRGVSSLQACTCAGAEMMRPK